MNSRRAFWPSRNLPNRSSSMSESCRVRSSRHRAIVSVGFVTVYCALPSRLGVLGHGYPGHWIEGRRAVRIIVVGLLLEPVALPALAQSQEQYDRCCCPTATDDQTIDACTALIISGRYSGAVAPWGVGVARGNLPDFQRSRAVWPNKKTRFGEVQL
jgi:hypothetical protein